MTSILTVPEKVTAKDSTGINQGILVGNDSVSLTIRFVINGRRMEFLRSSFVPRNNGGVRRASKGKETLAVGAEGAEAVTL